MSIINDALKKTQMTFKKKEKEPEKKPDPQAAGVDTSNVYEKLYKRQEDLKKVASAGRDSKQRPSLSGKKEPVKSKPAKKWLPALITLVILVVFSYGSFFFLSRYKPAQDLFQSITQKNNTGSRAHIVQQAPKKRNYKPGELVLSGTSLIDDKRVALINGEIYEVGDAIDGKEIISIDLNKIELRDNQTIITLKVH